MSDKPAIDVRNNAEKHRFEAVVDGHLAIAEYNLIKDGVIFTHTEVPSALEGKGVGSALVKAGLAWARTEKRLVMPQCPFFAAYMKKHAETHDIVHPSFRSALGITS